MTEEVIDRLYRIVDKRDLPLGAVLEQAMATPEKEDGRRTAQLGDASLQSLRFIDSVSS